nr:hypothetical protein CFP56_23591 [Quercus suber]
MWLCLIALSLSYLQRGARISSYGRSELWLFGLYGGSVKFHIELGLDLIKNESFLQLRGLGPPLGPSVAPFSSFHT